MSSPLLKATLPGYTSQTLIYKSTSHGDILVDVTYPVNLGSSPRSVLLHYHGGFLIVGDRYAFLPHWLVRASATRGWIFVTPDYRLLPESTAQSSVEDAVDAYHWVLSDLPQRLGFKLSSVLVAGSSAGAYLALAMAVTVQKKPSALLLIYGMLDATSARYTTPGTNIFGQPPIETTAILANYPMATHENTRPVISASPLPADISSEPRFGLISALHIDALYLDYMTGIDGLGRSVAMEGLDVIPSNYRNLFPLAFGNLSSLPPTMLLHGRNDSAVPVEQSLHAAEKLKAAGVDVRLETPDDAPHGFDSSAGDVDIDSKEGEQVTACEVLREAIYFLAENAP